MVVPWTAQGHVRMLQRAMRAWPHSRTGELHKVSRRTPSPF